MNTTKQTHVLVVDDDLSLLEIISMYLSTEFKVTTAVDGEEAVVKIQADHPDIAVVDVMMPKMDGFQVCQFVKNDDRYKAIPVILLTAKGQPQDVEKGRQVGADEYISKPFELKDLSDKIKTLV